MAGTDPPRAARRVAAALEAAGHPTEIHLIEESTRTVAEAAAALGVKQGQILKSMVLRGGSEDRLVLVILSGDRQVDLARVAAVLDEPVERADPDWVRERTGFSIGGIPPIAHRTPPTVLIDRDLLTEEILWA
ncbi:MAG TPA: YbaK/EbsC family protein, partial [Solirubrobacterales bacterium]